LRESVLFSLLKFLGEEILVLLRGSLVHIALACVGSGEGPGHLYYDEAKKSLKRNLMAHVVSLNLCPNYYEIISIVCL
jgi:hypothetical protein